MRLATQRNMWSGAECGSKTRATSALSTRCFGSSSASIHPHAHALSPAQRSIARWKSSVSPTKILQLELQDAIVDRAGRSRLLGIYLHDEIGDLLAFF